MTHLPNYISKVTGGYAGPQKMTLPISQATFQKSQGGGTCPPEDGFTHLPNYISKATVGGRHMPPQKMAALV